MRGNATAASLAAGQVVFGCFLRFPDAGLTEFLAVQGVDFIVFDAEHGVLSPADCEHMSRAAELHGVTPLVRVPDDEPSGVLRFLDAGAHGCHVPGVSSVVDAERAVAAVRYAPQGVRGLAPSRATGYGPPDGFASWVEHANQTTQLIVHIETVAGVDAADQIAAVDGIDIVLVGTLDLSLQLGVPGELTHPAIDEAVDHVAAAARRAGKTLGAVVGSPETLGTWVDRGARYLITPVESFIRPTVGAYTARVREMRAT